MERLILRTLLLGWALWLGGLVTLFMSVNTVFEVLKPDRQAAGNITAPIFGNFEKLGVYIAAITLVSALYLYVRRKTKSRLIALVLLLAATGISTGSSLLVTRKIEALRTASQTQTQEFKTLHGISMGLYSSVTLLLAAAGLVMPGVMRRETEPGHT